VIHYLLHSVDVDSLRFQILMYVLRQLLVDICNAINYKINTVLQGMEIVQVTPLRRTLASFP